MPVYLDHNATSPLHPEVVEAMLPFLQNPTGNPSSLHSYGRMVRSAKEIGVIQPVNELAAVARLEMEQKKHHLEQLRDYYENSLQDVEMLILKLQELVTKLPAVIRQAAV